MNARRGFTLVEILIVVVILAILAAIALPGFTNAAAVARASMLADDLRVIRIQLTTYKAMHRGVSAGYPVGGGAPDADTFIRQMTLASDPAGRTAPAGTEGFDLGPYLREMPVNPLNNLNTVLIVADGGAFPDPTGDFGWIYQPETLTLRADATGSDDKAMPYIEY